MSGTITDISPAYIEPSPDNPRRDVGDVTELAQSIAAVGVIEPLVVRPIGKRQGHEHYQVIVGHRRLAAASSAGVMWVPCIVRDYPEDQRAEIMLIENLQRVDLSPIEEGRAFRRLVDDFGWSQEKLGERIGRSQSHISKRLALMGLPEKAQDLVHSGGMTLETAADLGKLSKHPKQLAQVIDHIRPDGTLNRWDIDSALREVDRTEKRKEVLAELKAAGVVVIPEPKGGEGWWPAGRGETSEGPVPVAGWGILGHVDEEAHRAEPCRAVSIDRWNGVTELCTDRERHPRPDGKPLVDPDEEEDRDWERARAGEQAHSAAADQAAERRKAAARDLVARGTPRDLLDLLVSHSLALLFDEQGQEIVEDVAVLLVGEESCPEDADPYDWSYEQTISFAMGSDAMRLNLAAAAAIVDVEGRLRWGETFDRDAFKRYLQTLESRGYELADVEREAVEKADAAMAELVAGRAEEQVGVEEDAAE